MKRKQTKKSVNVELDFEPKMSNRWVLYFPKEFNIVPWLVKSVDRPKFMIENGKAIWQDMHIEFYDAVGKEDANGAIPISKALLDATVNNNKFKDFEIKLDYLGPCGDIIEKWNIGVDTINYVDFGKLDYSSDYPLTITMTIIPKHCTLDF